jgi:uncharacterized protein YjbJ (UPF0337 family)
MAGTTQEIKGRLEEAAGALAGSTKLRQRGKADQAAGKNKRAASPTKKRSRNALGRVENVVNYTEKP